MSLFDEMYREVKATGEAALKVDLWLYRRRRVRDQKPVWIVVPSLHPAEYKNLGLRSSPSKARAITDAREKLTAAGYVPGEVCYG